MKSKDKSNPLVHQPLSVLLALGLTATSVHATASQETDHQAHAMHHDMSTDAGAAGGVEDHSMHMQAMQSREYRRSTDSYSLPDLDLIDMHGDAVSIGKLLATDQPLVVNFIYTSCTTICPIMSATFSQAQRQMGEAAKPVKWVSISIDPEYDTPARLREYAERFHVGPNWQFITGDLQRIIALQRAFNVYNGSKTNHRPVTLLRAGRDRPWVRLEGLTSGAELVAEYQQLAAQ